MATGSDGRRRAQALRYSLLGGGDALTAVAIGGQRSLRKVQVVGIEAAEFFQTLEIQDDELLALNSISPRRRNSCKTRFVWTPERPIVSARSFCVRGSS